MYVFIKYAPYSTTDKRKKNLISADKADDSDASSLFITETDHEAGHRDFRFARHSGKSVGRYTEE